MYFERKFLLEPLLGEKYKYETLSLGEDRGTLEDAFKQVNEDIEQFIELEKKSNPIKCNLEPF